jgi:hypothetical protein
MQGGSDVRRIGHSPADSDLQNLGPPVLPMSKDQADIELPTVLDDLGVRDGSRRAKRCGSQK